MTSKSEYNTIAKSYQGLSASKVLREVESGVRSHLADERLIDKKAGVYHRQPSAAWQRNHPAPRRWRDFPGDGVTIRSDVVQLSPRDEILQALVKNWKEWNGDKPGDRNFLRRAKDQVLKDIDTCANEHTEEGGEVHSFDRAQKLSSDFNEAIKFVLENSINKRQILYSRVKDKISVCYEQFLAYEPYYENQRTGTYALKKRFHTVNETLLDPIVRFVACQMTKKEYFHWFFFEANDALLAGYIFEAIVASYVTNDTDTIRCQSCSRSGSLRWCGGPASPWTDLVCTNCNSTYEIKSKDSSLTIDKQVKDFNSITGGSFGQYQMLRRRCKVTNFIVMVGRKAEHAAGNVTEPYWRVSVAEIDTVLPRFKDRSFANTNSTSISIGSKIKVKVGTYRQEWFRIPYQSIDQKNLAREVFDDKFDATEFPEGNSDLATWVLPFLPSHLALEFLPSRVAFRTLLKGN